MRKKTFQPNNILIEIARQIKKRIPREMKFESIPRIYLSLRCNLRCPYCSDGLGYDYSEMGYKLLLGAEWIKIINSLLGNAVIFTGGEPLFHPDVAEIINHVNKQHIHLYSNFNHNVDDFLKKLKKQIYYSISFHPNNKSVKLEKTLKNLEALKRSNKYLRISLVSIDHPSNGSMGNYEKKFAEAGFKLSILRNQYQTNLISNDACSFKDRKKVKCFYDRFYLGPNGKRYICVSKLVRNKKRGIIELNEKNPEIICEEFGFCSPCDEVAEITHIK